MLHPEVKRNLKYDLFTNDVQNHELEEADDDDEDCKALDQKEF